MSAASSSEPKNLQKSLDTQAQNQSTTIMLIFVIGAPASGKGTLCQKWCHDHNFKHLSVGDHLRDMVREDKLDIDAKERISRCELLDIEQLNDILKATMDNLAACGHSNIIMDGFPRTVQQARAAESRLGAPSLVLHFDCPHHIAKERYMTRSLLGRDNDPLVFDRRFAEFSCSNAMVVQQYEQRGILVTIDSSKETHESYNNLLDALITYTTGHEIL